MSVEQWCLVTIPMTKFNDDWVRCIFRQIYFDHALTFARIRSLDRGACTYNFDAKATLDFYAARLFL